MPTRLQSYTKTFADRLLAAIAAGTAPWQKPWRAGELVLPTNLVTAHRYHGNNTILLLIMAALKGYSDARWAGFRQIADAGGKVRKGERGTPITVFRPRRTDDQDLDPAAVEDGAAAVERRPTTFCSVFNLEQTEGLEHLRPPHPATLARNCSAVVHQVAVDAHVDIRHISGDSAYYNRRLDFIAIPLREQFRDASGYEQTLLHELAHATMHPSRLDRPAYKIRNRKSDDYALEELRAEISTMMLGEQLGLGHQPQDSQAYVAGWLRKLKDDPDAVRKATADAQRIADWLTRNVETRAGERAAA
ncbi:MAG: zincin-like metallopeptidase domain-containing protein [Chromatiales bacterium]|nr:zincin-like metallopeptidase domain-containing protein [Chromatiales bacterium]